MTLVVRLLLLLLLFLFNSCSNSNKKNSTNHIHTIQGYAQGTTYNVKYIYPEKYIQKKELDSLLNVIDKSMSSYIDSSNLSLINNNETVEIDELLKQVLNKSLDLCAQTDGSFDVTVAPLVSAYGFGPENAINLDNDFSIGCDSFYIENGEVVKNENVQIDVNGIAQGFSVDFLSNYFKSKGVLNFMIEIGGEVYCSGMKKGEKWILGVSNPLGNPSDYLFKVPLYNKALATSGSTRKNNQVKDSVYTHIISPNTQEPIKNNLLSVSVIADNCMDADAYATAFMEMGLRDSKYFLESNELNIEVLFIYTDTISGEMIDFRTAGFNLL